MLQLISFPLRDVTNLLKLASGGGVGSNKDPEIPHPFAFRDPLEAHLLAPFPTFFTFAGPYRGCFIPVDPCSGGLAKCVQNPLGSFHVLWRALEIERRVIGKSLISDLPASREGQTFNAEARVVQHMP